MKNQLDLIIGVSVLLIAFILAYVWYATKREPVKPAAPPAVNLKPLEMPNGHIVFSNGLPGGGG